MKYSRKSQAIKKSLTQLVTFDQLEPDALLPRLQEYLALSNQYLADSFSQGVNVRVLVPARAKHVDQLLIALWRHLQLDGSIALIAVGGYGRGELHPHSDIDLLILSEAALSETQQKTLSFLISSLWDCHLKVGQAVRELDECVIMARDDVTIATNLMESRLLCGPTTLYKRLQKLTAPDQLWDPRSFYIAKTDEQKARYKKFDGTSFDLEPNVKSSPGGLRDIHLVGWIARRTHYPKSLSQLVAQNVITKKEYYSLVKGQLYIWRVRFALHLVSGKAEDRLLFDYQKSAAKLMGYKDSKTSLAVEKMMKRYYRSVLIIRNISDILLQVMEEELLNDPSISQGLFIDENFQVLNQRIDARHAKVFTQDPSQLLKVFVHVANDPTLKGITASTLRAIRAARYKITQSFRNKAEHKRLFIEFWHIKHTSSRAMFLMKRSGVLADYLKAFRQISGQMQYDMFHNYTVDEHTLFLLKNLSEFADPKHDHEFPLCSEIMQRQSHPEIIFLAGLFHDIAKGRGGDHSELGALEARIFCNKHKLPAAHSELIEWLVGNHLIMSMIAQKRDISDPKVIENFAELVKDPLHLELLYILTVADIRATSHTLWNSWKDSLLKNLFINTAIYFKENIAVPVDTWQTNQSRALKKLIDEGFDKKSIETLWCDLDPQYFGKRRSSTIAWQSKKILLQKDPAQIIVGIKSTPQRSGSEVFVYSQDKENLFAALTATLAQQGLIIQAANIYTDKKGYCYDSFIVLDESGNALKNTTIKNQIKRAIVTNLSKPKNVVMSVQRRMPRQLKYFSIPTSVDFVDDEYSGLTRMELVTRDQPGLLATVGRAFVKTKTKVHDARISTLGERAEDTFIISHSDDSPIVEKHEREKIRSEIINHLKK